MEFNEMTLEKENRIRNLVWTVSGDYTLQIKPDLERYDTARNTVLYDTVRQGAFAKYYDRDAFSLYLVKKIYCGAIEGDLLAIGQLVTEQAVSVRMEAERPGIRNLRRRSYEEILDSEFDSYVKSPAGRLKIAYMRYRDQPDHVSGGDIGEALSILIPAREAADTMELIRITDRIYNTYLDRQFEKRGYPLEAVLKISIEELKEFSWKDFLSEEAYEDGLMEYIEQVSADMTAMDADRNQKEQQTDGEQETERRKRKAIVIDEEALAKMHSYVERNYGRTYLSPAQERSKNHQYCRGIHSNCKVYYTEGILKNPVLRNYQLSYAQRQKSNNILAYHEVHRQVKQNIRTMTEMLKKSLIIRDEILLVDSDHGSLVANRMWQLGRSHNANLFIVEQKADARDMVVDILIDASGSQRPRQSQVVLQGYILAEALSNLGIPFRVMTYCTFWDYTILHRMRNYDDPRSSNANLFEYMTSSNNRDGLAIRCVGDELLKRQEEQKLLIILSDGKPNDRIVNRTDTRTPEAYVGEFAVKDTASQVRRLRQMGVLVLGVFAGDESELAAEKKIFGKDFAYIRDLKNFSKIVSRYLQKQIEE